MGHSKLQLQSVYLHLHQTTFQVPKNNARVRAHTHILKYSCFRQKTAESSKFLHL